MRLGFRRWFAACAPLVLALTAEPFEYPRSDWPKSVRLVGPGIWDPPAEPPPWLDATEPLILVTSSTELFLQDGRLIEAALAALRDEPVRLVVTTAAIDPARFAPQPRARIERFLPHRPLLARAACVVCHGGMGVTQKALAAGVPVCVVPFGRAAVRKSMACKAGAERIAAAFSATGPGTAAAALDELLPAGDQGRRPAA